VIDVVAKGSQRRLPAAAFEETPPKLRFQPFDRLRQRGLAHAALMSPVRKVAASANSKEVADLLQLHGTGNVAAKTKPLDRQSSLSQPKRAKLPNRLLKTQTRAPMQASASSFVASSRV